MFRDRISGIAVAATLGTATLLGATHANALINLDAKDKSNPVVLFSSELVDTTPIVGRGANAGMTWHSVTGATDALDIRVMLGHQVLQGDTIEVKFELTNMVFGTVETTLTGQVDPAAATVVAFTPTNPTAPGAAGLVGSSVATFLFTAPSNLSATATVTWDIGEATTGVFGIAPGGNGGITATVTNLTVARTGGTAGHMASYASAVHLGSSLSVGSTPSNLTADVADDFKSFTLSRLGNPTPGTQNLTGNVGKVFAKLASPAPVSPVDGSPVTVAQVMADTSTVKVTGNFGSFVSSVALNRAMNCATTSNVAVTITSGTAAAVAFSAFTGTTPASQLDHYLCITVNGTTEIPATEAYGAMLDFDVGSSNAALPSGSHPLGMIMRNGTTVHLPYLTKHMKFHQRIRLVNRGMSDVDYSMEFHGEDDEAGMDATGTLEAGTVTVLSLSDDDVVMLPAGRYNTSATLSIGADPTMIDVSTVQVTRATGASDTVVYSSAE